MDIKTFREAGYLQEVNRQFFHPLGLALEVNVNDDGTESLGRICDYRGDPEGLRYGDGMIDPEKAARIHREREEKASWRQNILGYVIQPPSKEST